MVLIMVDLGGLTRLTGSGLSMVEWQPLTLVPPLSAESWQRMFAAYQTSPQYRLVNEGMNLAQFKGIFWLEYIHRLWGRLIGAAFLLPFLVFLATGRIGFREAPRLLLLFVLGGLEGVLGWLMVKSGLADRPEVSHERLAAHLATGLVIYGAILWVALGYLEDGLRRTRILKVGVLRGWLTATLVLLCITIPMGALVAGLKAGMIYNTFPLMGGAVLPGEAFHLTPVWRNALDNPVLVQFDHRILAIATWIVAIVSGLTSLTLDLPARQRKIVALVPVMATLQAGLGIATLVLVVPMPLAAAHQLCAFLFAGSVIWAIHAIRS
jgi:cytochrome c oxidase assembly protein subunit 15